MISKQTIKYLRSLSVKKYRDEAGCFVAEGSKTVGDLLALLPCQQLFATESFLAEHPSAYWINRPHVETVTQSELERLSAQQAPHGALAVFIKPIGENETLEECAKLPATQLCLALDDVQDPGNLGTIIRLADWFGITHLFVSPHTADPFAPKVVQATMGAIGRVSVHRLDLTALVATLPQGTPVYGTFLDGNDLYAARIEQPDRGIVIMGNEGRGISPTLAPLATQRLRIPNYPPERQGSESLNVAVATALVCAELRRRLPRA